MDRRVPGLGGAYLEEETRVAIDGQIHETAYFQRMHVDAEVYFPPKIAAGRAGCELRGPITPPP